MMLIVYICDRHLVLVENTLKRQDKEFQDGCDQCTLYLRGRESETLKLVSGQAAGSRALALVLPQLERTSCELRPIGSRHPMTVSRVWES